VGDVLCRGGIGEAAFVDYYVGKVEGIAIHVGQVTRLAEPATLTDVVLGAAAPQSYLYADSGVIPELTRHAGLELAE